MLNVENLEKINSDGDFILRKSDVLNSLKYWKHLSQLAKEDLIRLYNHGSELTRIGLKILTFCTPCYPGFWNSKYDEFRVEEEIAYLWSLGIPGYRIHVFIREPEIMDGQMGFVVPTKDLELIRNNLLYDSKYTNAVHNYVTTNPIKPESTKKAWIFLSDAWVWRTREEEIGKLIFQNSNL